MSDALIQAAIDARNKSSYSPYSKFRVGAAIRTSSGNIYTGANIENASYSLCICAERVAACAAIMAGDYSFSAIACVGGPEGNAADQFCAPCGACRQFLYEFSNQDTILIGLSDNQPVSHHLHHLIPHAFGPKNLS